MKKTHLFFSIILLLSVVCVMSCESVAGSLLKVEIDSVAVSDSFVVYVGGGTNIEPPAPLPFQRGGIPVISMSKGDDGKTSSFLAGEVKAKDKNSRLIKVACTIKNPSEKPQQFRIGDISMSIDSVKNKDFLAVGLGSEPCAMSDDDRKVVKKKTINIPPGEQRSVTYIFGLFTPEPKQGELSLGNLASAIFKIQTK